METLEQEKNLQAPSWTPFVERSFWARVKATYAFVWHNKLTLLCFAVPLAVLLFFIGNIFIGNIVENTSMTELEKQLEELKLLFLQLLLYPMVGLIYCVVITISSLLKEHGALKGLGMSKWCCRLGFVALVQIVFAIILYMVISVPVMLLTFILMFLIIGIEGAMGKIIALIVILIPLIVLFTMFGILVNFIIMKLSIDYKDTMKFKFSIKDEWNKLKGNWWSTIGYFIACELSIYLVLAVLVALIALLKAVGICKEEILYIAVSVLIALYVIYHNVPMVYQFGHLSSKYEKKQAEEAALTEEPAEQEPEA